MIKHGGKGKKQIPQNGSIKVEFEMFSNCAVFKNKKEKICATVVDPGFPRRGASSPKGAPTYYLETCMINEEILVERGIRQCSISSNKLQEGLQFCSNYR